MDWGFPTYDNPLGDVSYSTYKEARKRGHDMAAAMVKYDPATRLKVEALYGKDVCKREWPEAYDD